MDDYEHVDWDAFIVLADDPEIDAATAFAASVVDADAPSDAASAGGARLVVLVVLLIVIAMFLLAV